MSIILGESVNIDVVRGSPVAIDFWLEQKNAEIRCSFDRFKNIEDHQTKKLTKSKIKTVNNTTFKIGDFISYKPGSKHSSFTKKGCLLLVFLRNKNKAL